MATWKIDIQKDYGNEVWTNRYLIEASGLAEASSLGQELVAVEKLFHGAIVNFNRLRVSDNVVDTDNYVALPLTGTGALTVTAPVPLFNVARVDLVPLTGRPGTKYYRGCIGENNSDNWSIDQTLIGAIVNAWDGWFSANPEVLIDPQATAYQGVVVQSLIGMRQLRRGSRRRTEPII